MAKSKVTAAQVKHAEAEANRQAGNHATTETAVAKKVHKKTECPVTRTQFKEKAPRLQVNVSGHVLTLDPREFATNSLGWFASEKMEVVIDGVPCKVQVGVNITVVGSKELPE